MHLTKLFNLSYFLQNAKKSKTILFILALLVPLFTSLVLILGEMQIVRFSDLTAVNMIGLYVIPLLLSKELFNFVYKKNSTDFIASMPISKKSIFCTNTLGGIAILVIIQLINMLCTYILSGILYSSSIIFPSMIWEAFVFYTISYIFVFTIANLAITFSSNRISQIVSTMLITFTIPFLVGTGKLFYENSNYVKNIETNESFIVEENFNFTAPNYPIDGIINMVGLNYNQISVNKMLILSLIYIGLGVFLFQRKNFEFAGESYETKKLHLIVKLFTLIPFMFLFCVALEESYASQLGIFLIAVMAIYYFVFDIVTNKKVKIGTSIWMFLISMAVIYSYYTGVASHFDLSNTEKIIKSSDVESVVISGLAENWRGEKMLKMTIEDEELIKHLVTSTMSTSTFTTNGGGIEITESMSAERIENYEHINIVVRLKNGKEYTFVKLIKQSELNQILQQYGNEKIDKKIENMRLRIGEITITKEEEQEILNMIKNEFNQIDSKMAFEIYQNNDIVTTHNSNIILYDYNKHNLKTYVVPYTLSSDIYEKVVNLVNQDAMKKMDSVRYVMINDEDRLYEYVAEYCEKNNIILPNSVIGSRVPTKDEFYYISSNSIYDSSYDLQGEASQAVIDWIKNNTEEVVTLGDKYLVVESYYPGNIMYYTSNIDAICKIYVDTYLDIYAQMQE